MRKVLFLDRDGVINKDVSYLYKIADLQWVDGAKEALKLAHDSGYELIVVTNQSGVARGYYKETDVQSYMIIWEMNYLKREHLSYISIIAHITRMAL